MGKIRDTLIYPVKELPVLEDYLIGSDSETGNKRTVNFSLLKIKELLAAGRLLNGTVDPVDGDGSIGDFYINTATWQIFGPKGAVTWPSGVDMIGAPGADGLDGQDGKTLLSGTVDPVLVEGVDGDFYINTATWQIFGPKDPATGWGAGTNLVGADGVDGLDGAPGADGAPGIGFTWMGSWDQYTEYLPYDVVEYNGSSYVCVDEYGVGVDPETGLGYFWELMAQKGDDGDPSNEINEVIAELHNLVLDESGLFLRDEFGYLIEDEDVIPSITVSTPEADADIPVVNFTVSGLTSEVRGINLYGVLYGATTEYKLNAAIIMVDQTDWTFSAIINAFGIFFPGDHVELIFRGADKPDVETSVLCNFI